MSKGIQPQEFKPEWMQALRAILPPTAEVTDMLRAWEAADARYWGQSLMPCWLTCSIEPYGKFLGSWNDATRTLNLVPQLWSPADGLDTARVPRIVAGVMVHECCHAAQGQMYRHLDAAKGPRGQWTDRSHRCPSWSRAVEDVIQRDGLPVFCPVWHRSSGNQWFPWVPASDDWMTWERADPDATFDGRRLLNFYASRSFMPRLSMLDLLESLNLPAESKSGALINWEI